MARMIRQNPRAFETLTARIRELDGKQVKVGWFSSSVYPNGTPVALVAAVQELGSPAKNIPPRLGMRATAMRKWGEWKDLMLDGAKAILQGRRTADQVMDAMGAKAAGRYRQKHRLCVGAAVEGSHGEGPRPQACIGCDHT